MARDSGHEMAGTRRVMPRQTMTELRFIWRVAAPQQLIDRSRCFDKSALSLQVRAGRGYSPAVGIEDRDPITVVVLVMEFKFIAVIAMCPACHDDAHEIIPRAAAIPSQY